MISWFKNELQLPVFVENDANAAAIAERVTGVAQSLKSYAFLYLGTGLGLGMVDKGALRTGASGNAGEIGHIPVPLDGSVVPLENAVSRLSVQRALSEVGITISDGAELVQLYQAGNPALMAWLDRARLPLSVAITTIENLLDPETIILGGAMPDVLLDHLMGTITLPEVSVANRADRQNPRLIRGSSGRMTATLGAAALVINRAFTPTIAIAH